MRTHIAKALQKWSKAIQHAVKIYKAAASALDPPRPTIDWNTVSHYKFLEDLSSAKKHFTRFHWETMGITSCARNNETVEAGMSCSGRNHLLQG